MNPLSSLARHSSTASSAPVDFRLVLHDSLLDSYGASNVLLAKAGFDGTLQLLTSGWEHVLGYAREEFRGKTLFDLMWSNQRSAAAAVAAILDKVNMGAVYLRLRCSDGLGKRLRLHRQYDKHEDMIYIVAEETFESLTPVAPDREERRSALRHA